MTLHRFAKKRDANEPIIADYFRKSGLSVEYIDTPSDMILGYANSSYLVEIKTEKGKLTKRQSNFIKDWQGDYYIIRTLDDAKALTKYIKTNLVDTIITDEQTIINAMEETFKG